MTPSLWFCTGSPSPPWQRSSEQLIRGSFPLFMQMMLLMRRGPDQGYFPEPAKSLFISDTPGQESGAKRELAAEGLTLNLVSGSRYLGAYLGPQAELEA